MNREIQDRIDAVDWYHEFDFGNGLVAKPKFPEDHPKFWAHIRSRLDRVDFAGKTVLDIGCWDGYWAYYAEQRGASYVLATDDCDQNWAGDAGLRLAKEVLHSSIEINTRLSVYELISLRRKFDIILCLGVYYHLVDPFFAFAQIRHCCHENSVVIFEGDVRSNLGLPPGAAIHHFTESEGGAARFRPTPAVLASLLETAYLKVESESFLLPWDLHHLGRATSSVENQALPPASIRNRLKRAIVAFKANDKKRTEISSDIQPLYNREVVICRPFRGENRCFWYRPPFGLDQYDTRWERDHVPK